METETEIETDSGKTKNSKIQQRLYWGRDYDTKVETVMLGRDCNTEVETDTEAKTVILRSVEAVILRSVEAVILRRSGL
jgi:hypothetical protein